MLQLTCVLREDRKGRMEGPVSLRSLMVSHQGMWFVRWSDHPTPEKRGREASRARHPKSSR